MTSRMRGRGKQAIFAFAAASGALSGVEARAADLIDAAHLDQSGVVFQAPVAIKQGIDFVLGVGDVDGDGLGDLVFTVITENAVGDSNPYRVALVFGREGLSGRHVLDPSFPGAVFFSARTPEAGGAWLAHPFQPLGDMDGDGHADFCLVSNPSFLYVNGVRRGAVCLIYGAPGFYGLHDAQGPLHVDLEDIGHSIRGTVFWSSELDKRGFGHEAAGIGDFNGDGDLDLAIGEPAGSIEERHGGIVYIVLGLKRLPALVDLAATGVEVPGVKVLGAMVPGNRTPLVGEKLGVEVRPIGDFDGDGLDDLIVRSLGGASLESRKRMYLVYGSRAPPPVIDMMVLAEGGSLDEVTLIRADPNPDAYPGTASGLGDLNGDGRADFLFGQSGECCDPFTRVMGQVWIHFGMPVRPPEIDFGALPPGSAVGFFRGSLGLAFGGPLAPAGDLNRDGVPDFLAGAARTSRGGMELVGEVFAIHGRRDFPPEVNISQGFEGLHMVGEDRRDAFGARVATGGDFDGDGALDIVVLARNSHGQGPGQVEDYSRAYLIYGETGEPGSVRVNSVERSWGPLRGGTVVTVQGRSFRGSPQVRFGGLLASSVELLSRTQVRAVTPAGSRTGLVDVSVEVGGETATLPSGFEYTANFPDLDLGRLGSGGFILEGLPGRAFTSLTPSGMAFGDLTGDGVDELAVESASRDWVVSVVRGGPELPPSIPDQEPSDRLTIIRGVFDVEPSYGCGVTYLGDVSGDGLGDLGIGAGNAGYIVLGRREFPHEIDVEYPDAEGVVRLDRPQAQPGWWMTMARLADVTGDGIEDMALGVVGSTVDPGDWPERGEVLLVAGRGDWDPVHRLDAPGAIMGRIQGSEIDSELGTRLRAAGDVNGDGLVDLLASTKVRERQGRTYLIYGTRDIPEKLDVESLVHAGGGAAIDHRVPNLATYHIAGPGDVNRDGLSDILIGVEAGGASFQGITYLIYGRRDFPPLLEVHEVPAAPDGVVRIFGEGESEQAGRVNAAGDYNDDGFADFLIGGPGLQTSSLAGSVFLMFGGPDIPERIELARVGGRGIEIDGRLQFGGAGAGVGPFGDLNGDGQTDFSFSEWDMRDNRGGSVYVIYGPFGPKTFRRGDANRDGRVDISDAVFILSFLFMGGDPPTCFDALDVDDSGTLGLTDAVYLLSHVFLGDEPPPEPYRAPGLDRTQDPLGCLGF